MFYVGQKVVCVNDVQGDFNLPGFNYHRTAIWDIVEGEVYTVKELTTNEITGQPCVKFVELRDRIANCFGYNRGRFRPAVEKKTDISIFKAMLNKTSQQNRKELLNV